MDSRATNSPAGRWTIVRRIVGLPLSRRGTLLRVIGSFVTLGPMACSHELGQTATLLSDGRVLILGGTDLGSNEACQAEIYDPKTGNFVEAGSTQAASSYHSAILLSDGSVFIVGSDYTALYDPKTGAFTDSPSAVGTSPRRVTPLSDGRVFVQEYNGKSGEATGWEWCKYVGGTNTGCTAEYVPTGEAWVEGQVFDPVSGAYGSSGRMNTARSHYTTTLLADGRVLIAGGLDDNKFQHEGEDALDSAELFDPTTGKFTETGRMITARSYHTATLLADGRVLITGGRLGLAGTAGSDELDSAEIYDPKTGAFTPTGSMFNTNSGHTATLLADGRVLVFGYDAETYDPKTGKFTRTGPVIPVPIITSGNAVIARTNHTATLLADGRVLIVGGTVMDVAGAPDASSTTRSAELFQP